MKNTVDFVSFSYYYTPNVDEQGNQIPNRFIKSANAWGWGFDPDSYLRIYRIVYKDE